LRVGALGNPPPHAVWYYHPPPRTFGVGPARSGVLAVRVWLAPGGSFASGDLGGFVAAPILGSPEAISATKDSADYRWLRQRQFSFGVGALYILLCVLSFLAWMRDRRQRLIFWLATWSGALSALFLLLSLRIPWSFIVSLGVAQPFFGIINISIWFLLALLLSLDEHPKLMRVVHFLAIVQMTAFTLDGLLVLLIPALSSRWTVDFQWADGILTAIFTVLQALPLVLIVYAVIVRPRLGFERWLVAICAFIDDMIPTLRIAFSQGVRFTHWTIAQKIAAPLFTFNGNRINAGTLADTILLVAIIYAVYRYVVEERNRQNALEQEFQNARELQQVLIPEALPSLPGFTLTSAYKPAQEVGGDFFQIIPLGSGPLGSGSTLVILGDVSGKGLKAAMAVSLIVGATRMVAEFTTSPAEILAGLNRRLHGRLQGGFATCVAMRLDPDGSCTIASAGHPAPYINGCEAVVPGALPLGIAAEASYEETEISLHPGDHLALCTDGLLEARNPAGELYGFDRMRTLFASNPTAEQATQAAVAFGQDDDITVLTLTRLAAGESSKISHQGPILVRA
jgi:serine phosphatase RsbU (regulator of sigma subunit)